MLKFEKKKSVAKRLNEQSSPRQLAYWLPGAESFVRSWPGFSYSRNSPYFMETEGSLPHSQVPATCPYSEVLFNICARKQRLLRREFLVISTADGRCGVFMYVSTASISSAHKQRVPFQKFLVLLEYPDRNSFSKTSKSRHGSEYTKVLKRVRNVWQQLFRSTADRTWECSQPALRIACT